MRILLISAAPCVHDARPRFAARTLAALGHDVTLLCRGGPGLPAEEQLGAARLIDNIVLGEGTDSDPRVGL